MRQLLPPTQQGLTLVGLIHLTATRPKVGHWHRLTSPNAPSPILASTVTWRERAGTHSLVHCRQLLEHEAGTAAASP